MSERELFTQCDCCRFEDVLCTDYTGQNPPPPDWNPAWGDKSWRLCSVCANSVHSEEVYYNRRGAEAVAVTLWGVNRVLKELTGEDSEEYLC